MLLCNNPVFDVHHKIAMAFFNADVKEFLEQLSKLSEVRYQDWFICKRWSAKPEVKKFLKGVV